MHSSSITLGFDESRADLVSVRAQSGGMVAALGTSLLLLYIISNEANIPGSATDWQDQVRVLCCCCCGLFGVVSLSLTRTMPELFRWPAIFSTVFGIWCVLTIPISANPLFASLSCVTLWGTLLFAPAILHHLGGRRTTELCALALFLILVASWATLIFFPGLGWKSALGETTRFAGLNHPNTTAGQATLLLGLCLAMRKEGLYSWKVLWLPVLVACATLPMTGSRQNFGTAAIIATVIMVPRRKILPCVILGMAAVAAFVAFESVNPIDWESKLSKLTRSGDVDEIYNLTGRTEHWGEIVALIADNPFTGYGHGCSRFVAWGHAHNLILNVAVTTGLIGVACIVGLLLILGIDFLRGPNMFADLIFLYILIRGVTTSPLFNPIPGGASLLFALAVYWRQMGMTLAPTHGPLAEEISAEHVDFAEEATV